MLAASCQSRELLMFVLMHVFHRRIQHIGAQGARAPPFWGATHANYIATREAHILGLSTVE